VPPGTVSARIELHFRWDEDGKVNFGGISFEKTGKPKPRFVKVATIGDKPQNSPSSRANLEFFAKYIKKVADLKADIVCLPEGITLVGTSLNYISASEAVPGPSTEFLGEVARENGIYIVAGILEKLGEVGYNTAVLIDREGKLAGKYRKISLPREEIDGGVTPGDSLPVFDTDFGRVGMMICWDVTFPETARKLSTQGAEIILMPIWGGNVTLARARAIENQVYLVSASYDMVSGIFGKEGEILRKTTKSKPYAIVDINLAERKLWPWLGEFKHRIAGEMPPKKALMP
jgi:predicted amidohydrolase